MTAKIDSLESAARLLPALIFLAIAERAALSHPGDYRTQSYIIILQSNAWLELSQAITAAQVSAAFNPYTPAPARV